MERAGSVLSASGRDSVREKRPMGNRWNAKEVM